MIAALYLLIGVALVWHAVSECDDLFEELSIYPPAVVAPVFAVVVLLLVATWPIVVLAATISAWRDGD